MAGTGVSAGGGGDVESVGVVGSSSDGSLPLRFLPCRRHGNNGVARTRTSHGNLSREQKQGKLVVFKVEKDHRLII